MFSLSKRARLGLYAMVELAREPGVQASTEELARRLGVSVNHLSKVLQRFAYAGWVTGTRGAGGGYRIAVDPRTVSMADVIVQFEPAPDFSACSLADRRDCVLAPRCTIKHVFREIEEHAYYTLRSITVHLLAHPPETSRPG